MVMALDLQLRGCRFAPGHSLSGNNSGHIVHTHVPLSPNNIIWYWPNASGALCLSNKVTVD